MKALFAVLLPLLVCSCAATLPPKKAPEKASITLEQDFKTAQAAATAGEGKKALARLKKIVAAGPESDVADDAHFLMGQIYSHQGQSNEALHHYMEIVKSPLASPLEPQAALQAIRIYNKLGKFTEAREVFDHVGSDPQWTSEQINDLEKLRYENAVALKKNQEALATLVTLSERQESPSEREKYQSMARSLLDSNLSEDELREVSSERRFGFLRAPAKFRYATLLLERNEYDKSKNLLTEVLDLSPGAELTERTKTLIQQIDSRNQVDTKTIGVVLPLSGKQQAIGYKALRGIQLGLGVYGRAPSSFRLAVIDSEGNPDVARRAVERLVTEDNVIALIGGLLSRTATAEATKAQELGVPAIMLSQKSGITQVGDSVFRNALTSQMQVHYLVDLAMNQLGFKNFAIVFPNDAYGVEYTNLFWDEVMARGGTITGAQPYDPKETDFRGPIQRLVGTYYTEDRASEYGLRIRAWQEKNPKRSARQAPPAMEEILPPIVDFDALFIPDSARAVGQVAPMLAYNNVNKVTLLGTNLWNSQNLVARGQKFVENSVFVDSVLASDPSFQNSEFFMNFKSTFDEDPGLTEVQAYDSALVLRQLIAGGESSRSGLRQKMASLKAFPGAVGSFSVTTHREFMRPMSALTVKSGQITTLAPAAQ